MKEPSSYLQFSHRVDVCVGNLFHGSLFLYTLLLVLPKSQLPLAALFVLIFTCCLLLLP